MQRRRIFAVLVVALGTLTVGGPVADAAPHPTIDVSVAVPMTCVGQTTTTQTVTVSATLPSRVRAGRAYTVTNLTTDVPQEGAVTVAASDGHPAVFAAGSGGSSTVQLVAGAHRRRAITLQVTRADYLIPGSLGGGGPRPILTPGVRVGCTPDAPVTLGSIKVVGPGRGPATATTGIDVTLGMESRLSGVTFVGHPARITATVPTELRPGETFTLSDLRLSVPLPFTALAIVVADGADPSDVTPASVHRVTAGPGGLVELRLVRIDYDIGVVQSFPLGSGHLASIPVVLALR